MDTTLVWQTLLHIDQFLFAFVANYGAWTYLVLFLIIFCETGLLITPFFPGDSLLFAAGSLAANTPDALNIYYLFILLLVASIVGNLVNYLIGRFLGHQFTKPPLGRFINQKYLMNAHIFYEKHGGKTIIFARFIPIIRTFAPFVAGLSLMSFGRFTGFNILSALLWIGSLLFLGFTFGNLTIVKENFTFVIYTIILVSLIPACYALIGRRFKHG